VNASWTLFNGFKTRTQVRNAYFIMQQNELLYKQTNTIVEAALIRAWKTFNYSAEAMKLEEDNILLARENVNIAMERFRIGSSTAIELMIAQKSYEDALSRLVTARYEAKLAETELKRLNGELVK
jgi:outer membrane protein